MYNLVRALSTKYFFKKENYEPKSWEFSINLCLFKGQETTIDNLNNNIFISIESLLTFAQWQVSNSEIII
jgi:hypothetical protein